MSQPGPEASAEERRQARRAIPKPVPAYLPTAGSPLTVDKPAYEAIQAAPRELIEEFTIPIRSGKAWEVPQGCIARITTPEGPQVGMYMRLTTHLYHYTLLPRPCFNSFLPFFFRYFHV